MDSKLHVALADADSAFVLVVRGDRRAAHSEWRFALTDPRDYTFYSELAIICTANDLNATAIWSEWEGRLTFEDDLAQTVFMRNLVVGVTLNKVAQLHADWEVNGVLPDGHHVESHPELPLAPYQKMGVILSRMCPGYGFYLEQGCGKTPMTVARICTDALDRRGDQKMLRVLVVCPKDLRLNWKNEIERFATVPGKVTVLRGGPVKRIRALAEAIKQDDPDHKFTVIIVSYGLLTQAWDNVIKHVPWHLSVLDEAQNIKSPSADRSKVAHELRDQSTARLELTGTPITNSVMDLYSLLEFLDRGMSGHKSHAAFKAKHGVYEKSHDGTCPRNSRRTTISWRLS
jgi:SNF2 family DNA or RNA helicase